MSSLRSEFVIQTVIKALDTLGRETDLSPRNNTINKTLTNLVKTLASTYELTEEAEILSDPRVQKARPRLLEKLSIAEAEMEKFWSDHFLGKDTLEVEDLKGFWYWDCYEKLVDKEIACLPAEKATADSSAVFIGAGALPLSAVILHQKTGMTVTCVDSDPDACRKADALFQKLGLNDMRVICADGEDLNYNRFDTAFVASLVPQEGKDLIIEEIRNSKTETLLAVRSAERLHSLLYDPFNEASPNLSSWNFINRTAHDSQVINTTLLYHSPAGRPAPAPGR